MIPMKNRTKIISSILFWVLVLLASILLINSLSNSSFNWSFSFNDNTDRILIQEETISDPITTLFVDWTVGSVTIEGTDQSTIKIKEYANKELSQRQQASIDVDSSTLSIESRLSSSFSFLFWQSPINHLHVFVPYEILEKLDVQQTSGSLNIENLTSKDININLTSGLATQKKLVSDSLSAEMTSGNMTFEDIESDLFNIDLTSGVVNAKRIEADQSSIVMTSGLVNVEFINQAPSFFNGKINAGNATIDLPESADFTLETNITSGNLTTNFP